MTRRLAGLLALLPLLAHSAWMDASGRPLPDTESMRSAGEFGVQVVVTGDEAEFRKAWSDPKTPPKLKAVSTVAPGGAASAMLIFHGCAPGPQGACDVVSEFSLEDPQGVVQPAGGGAVWTGRPMPSRNLQLGQASLTVVFDATDPVGEYKITAKVRDQVAGRGLTVVGRVRLTK